MITLAEIVSIALAEDLPTGHDVTSEWLVSAGLIGEGYIVPKADGIISGCGAVAEVFKQVDSELALHWLRRDGERAEAGQRIVDLRGNARSILKAERTALNFLCHLSGVATVTRSFATAAAEFGSQVLATRKTTPGLRELELQAVRHGGGDVYRTNLSDAVLAKDNHLVCVGGLRGIGAELEQLRAARAAEAELTLRDGKLEVTSLEDLDVAVALGWKQILLDNFTPDEVAQAVRAHGDSVSLEASGGIHSGNLREYAKTGVHYLSIGALTHSVPALDFSLEVEWKAA